MRDGLSLSSLTASVFPLQGVGRHAGNPAGTSFARAQKVYTYILYVHRVEGLLFCAGLFIIVATSATFEQKKKPLTSVSRFNFRISLYL
jgi:hypothetical protein